MAAKRRKRRAENKAKSRKQKAEILTTDYGTTYYGARVCNPQQGANCMAL
jgi:hypothetical protein